MRSHRITGNDQILQKEHPMKNSEKTMQGALFNMRHQYKDPVTGDPLSLGEYISWLVQGIIRRWFFLLLITLATTVAWVVGMAHPQVLIWWNLAASYAAILIESIVGMFMFGQMKRDAVILRHLERLTEHLDTFMSSNVKAAPEDHNVNRGEVS